MHKIYFVIYFKNVSLTTFSVTNGKNFIRCYKKQFGFCYKNFPPSHGTNIGIQRRFHNFLIFLALSFILLAVINFSFTTTFDKQYKLHFVMYFMKYYDINHWLFTIFYNIIFWYNIFMIWAIIMLLLGFFMNLYNQLSILNENLQQIVHTEDYSKDDDYYQNRITKHLYYCIVHYLHIKKYISKKRLSEILVYLKCMF